MLQLTSVAGNINKKKLKK